ncbi:Glycosidase [Anaerocolumna jejuensis DSM 15929]|uniref:Glycosidase n=1 Tax=Anaerocolumna jejuensis DSM 15929 TaxID=1121322 RepID=A0A1M6UZ41_9FIRM|nr:glycoside hydrolase family 13 protein [Anaerocolumna jejuensis]SHK74326.1 Glycosidase [Anaerocolumna jejuensis DSM 15929]
MIRTVVLHKNTLDYVYVKARNKLVLKLETAKGSFQECRLIYWARTESDTRKRKSRKMELQYRDNMLDYYYAEMEFSKTARYTKYFFELIDQEGKRFYYTEYDFTEEYPADGYFEYLYANPGDVLHIPEWARGQVFYQIFPERFRNGDSSNDPAGCAGWGEKPTRENYMGGDLRGILQKLDYIQSLGTDCIYLNPVFKGDFNHKYATTDYYRIDESFGTNEDLKELADECHARGMKIILDGVFNHCGTSFEPFLDVMEHQENSKYKDWFHITSFPAGITHRDYECVGAYKWMPKLCTSNQEVCRFILQVMEYWISYAGIDGWRLDVADEVDPYVWRTARVYLKEKYPDILLVGETWSFGRKMLSGDQMDSVMNYVFRDAMLDFIAYKKIDSVELDERLNHMMAGYYEEYNHAMYNLLDSHDTARFLFSCGEDKNKLKLAAAFQFLMPGAPAVYYGDEIGLTGDNDPDCRRTMPWEEEEQDQELLSWYRRLSEIRHQEPAIRQGSYKTILAEKENNVYGFERSLDNIHIKILINNSEKPAEINLSTGNGAIQKEIPLGEQNYRNFSENGDSLPIKLEPYSVKIIKFEEVKL